MKLLLSTLLISKILSQVIVSQNGAVSTSGNGAYAVSSSGGQFITSSNGNTAQPGQTTQTYVSSNGASAVSGNGILIPGVIASAGGVTAIAGNTIATAVPGAYASAGGVSTGTNAYAGQGGVSAVAGNGAFASTGTGASTWSGTTVNNGGSYAYAGPDGTYTSGNGAASSSSGQKISTSTSGPGSLASAYTGGNGYSQTSTSTTSYVNGKLVTQTTHYDSNNPIGASTSTSTSGQDSYVSSSRTYDIGQGCTVTEKTVTINGNTQVQKTYTGPNCASYQQQNVNADTTDQYVQDALGDKNSTELKKNISNLAESIKEQIEKFSQEFLLSFTLFLIIGLLV